MTSIELPGERKVHRLGASLFRVWVGHPASSAELYKDGEWVYTPIPCGSILETPIAEELSDAEVDELAP